MRVTSLCNLNTSLQNRLVLSEMLLECPLFLLAIWANQILGDTLRKPERSEKETSRGKKGTPLAGDSLSPGQGAMLKLLAFICQERGYHI